MDKIEYEGKTYERRKDKWTDGDGMVVHEGLQKILNRALADTQDRDGMPVDECVKQGDAFKSSSSYALALQYYEAAVGRCDYEMMSVILPRMTSCYRKTGQPQKAIDILTYASKAFGQGMLNPALLTSAAAASCDMKDYERAKKCCDRAYAMTKGRASGELASVYGRIKKETGE